MRLFSWIRDLESFYKVANQRLNTFQIKYNSTCHKDWLWCRFYPIKISGKTNRSPKNPPKIIFLETYCSFISTACKYMQRSYKIYFWLLWCTFLSIILQEKAGFFCWTWKEFRGSSGVDCSMGKWHFFGYFLWESTFPLWGRVQEK